MVGEWTRAVLSERGRPGGRDRCGERVGAPDQRASEAIRGRFATVGGSNLDTDYDVSSDGQRFLMIKADENIGAAGIIVVQDFMTELKARVRRNSTTF